MTRLTIASPGNSATFSPVSSTITRKTKDGDLNVVIMLFGTEYNISMDGILQITNTGDISNDSVSVADSKVKIAGKKSGTTTPVKIGAFSSFMYFYPKIKIRANLEISEASDSTDPLPDLYGYYQFEDLLTGNKLIFKLKRLATKVVFQFIKIVGTTETIIYSKDLPSGETNIDFEFRYLEGGKSKLYFLEYDEGEMTFDRQWIGNLGFNPSECKVSLEMVNASTSTVKNIKSDRIFLKYPSIYLSYDVDSDDYYKGQILLRDDNNKSDEDSWTRVISRDYKFNGDHVIENGIVRIVIKSHSPVIEVYGWNYLEDTPAWELIGKIVPLSDNKALPNDIQNLVINYISVNQIKLKINFGTVIYNIRMTRGCPFINITSVGSKYFKVVTTHDRFIADFTDSNKYDLDSSVDDGYPEDSDSTISSPTMKDNWWSWYNKGDGDDISDQVVGWLSNLVYPDDVDVSYVNDHVEVLFTYEHTGNLFAFGILPSSMGIVNSKPLPYNINNLDKYVKWRANESLIAFKQDNFIRRRV